MSGSCPGNASWEAKPAAGCANISLIFCAGLALDAPLEQDIQAAGATHTKDCFGPATSRLLRKSVGVVRWFCGFSAFFGATGNGLPSRNCDATWPRPPRRVSGMRPSSPVDRLGLRMDNSAECFRRSERRALSHSLKSLPKSQVDDRARCGAIS